MADNPLNSPLNAPAEQEGQVRIELDDSGVDGLYSNLCRVSSTPEEVILDLALNPNNRINSFSISNGQKCRKREYRSRVCFVFSHLDSQDSTSIYIGIYWSKYCFCDSFIYQTSVFTFK